MIAKLTEFYVNVCYSVNSYVILLSIVSMLYVLWWMVLIYNRFEVAELLETNSPDQ